MPGGGFEARNKFVIGLEVQSEGVFNAFRKKVSVLKKQLQKDLTITPNIRIGKLSGAQVKKLTAEYRQIITEVSKQLSAHDLVKGGQIQSISKLTVKIRQLTRELQKLSIVLNQLNLDKLTGMGGAISVKSTYYGKTKGIPQPIITDLRGEAAQKSAFEKNADVHAKAYVRKFKDTYGDEFSGLFDEVSLQKQFARSFRGAVQPGLPGLGLKDSGEFYKAARLTKNEFTDIFRRVAYWSAGIGLLFGTLSTLRSELTKTLEFEDELIEFQKILGDTTPIKSLRKEIFNFSKTFGIGVEGTREIMKTWAQQGFEFEQIMQLTRSTLIGVNATTMEAGAAVEFLTSIMRSYNMTAEETVSIWDKLMEVQRNYAIQAPEIADGLKMIAAIGAQAGESIDTLIGYITAIKEVTRDTGKATGNALKTIMARLTSLEHLKTLQTYGIGTHMMTGERAPLRLIAHQIMARYQTGQIAGAELIDIAKTLGGIRKYREALILLQRLFDAEEVRAQSLKAYNVAQVEAARTMEEYRKKVEQMKATWSEFFHSFYSTGEAGVVSVLRLLVESLTILGSTLTKLAKAVPNFSTAIIGGLGFLFARKFGSEMTRLKAGHAMDKLGVTTAMWGRGMVSEFDDMFGEGFFKRLYGQKFVQQYSDKISMAKKNFLANVDRDIQAVSKSGVIDKTSAKKAVMVQNYYKYFFDEINALAPKGGKGFSRIRWNMVWTSFLGQFTGIQKAVQWATSRIRGVRAETRGAEYASRAGAGIAGRPMVFPLAAMQGARTVGRLAGGLVGGAIYTILFSLIVDSLFKGLDKLIQSIKDKGKVFDEVGQYARELIAEFPRVVESEIEPELDSLKRAAKLKGFTEQEKLEIWLNKAKEIGKALNTMAEQAETTIDGLNLTWDDLYTAARQAGIEIKDTQEAERIMFMIRNWLQEDPLSEYMKAVEELNKKFGRWKESPMETSHLYVMTQFHKGAGGYLDMYGKWWREMREMLERAGVMTEKQFKQFEATEGGIDKFAKMFITPYLGEGIDPEIRAIAEKRQEIMRQWLTDYFVELFNVEDLERRAKSKLEDAEEKADEAKKKEEEFAKAMGDISEDIKKAFENAVARIELYDKDLAAYIRSLESPALIFKTMIPDIGKFNKKMMELKDIIHDLIVGLEASLLRADVKADIMPAFGFVVSPAQDRIKAFEDFFSGLTDVYAGLSEAYAKATREMELLEAKLGGEGEDVKSLYIKVLETSVDFMKRTGEIKESDWQKIKNDTDMAMRSVFQMQDRTKLDAIREAFTDAVAEQQKIYMEFLLAGGISELSDKFKDIMRLPGFKKEIPEFDEKDLRVYSLMIARGTKKQKEVAKKWFVSVFGESVFELWKDIITGDFLPTHRIERAATLRSNRFDRTMNILKNIDAGLMSGFYEMMQLGEKQGNIIADFDGKMQLIKQKIEHGRIQADKAAEEVIKAVEDTYDELIKGQDEILQIVFGNLQQLQTYQGLRTKYSDIIAKMYSPFEQIQYRYQIDRKNLDEYYNNIVGIGEAFRKYVEDGDKVADTIINMAESGKTAEIALSNVNEQLDYISDSVRKITELGGALQDVVTSLVSGESLLGKFASDTFGTKWGKGIGQVILDELSGSVRQVLISQTMEGYTGIFNKFAQNILGLKIPTSPVDKQISAVQENTRALLSLTAAILKEKSPEYLLKTAQEFKALPGVGKIMEPAITELQTQIQSGEIAGVEAERIQKLIDDYNEAIIKAGQKAEIQKSSIYQDIGTLASVGIIPQIIAANAGKGRGAFPYVSGGATLGSILATGLFEKKLGTGTIEMMFAQMAMSTLGAALGSIFAPNQPFQDEEVKEDIRRIADNTNYLKELSDRIINAPADFIIPAYAPRAIQAGSIVFNISGSNPDEIVNRIREELEKDFIRGNTNVSTIYRG